MTGFSAEDFARFQTQLLELREKNYGLEDQLKKQVKEAVALRDECGRAAAAVRASKKASEVEGLARDNNLLRARLRDQEEDFNLQNSTLLQELAKVVSENEQLETQVAAFCGDVAAEATVEASTDDSKQAVALRAEVCLLEKRLGTARAEQQREATDQRSKHAALAEQNARLTKLLSHHSILQDEGAIELDDRGTGGVTFKKLSLNDGGTLDGGSTWGEQTGSAVAVEECNTLRAQRNALQLQLSENQTTRQDLQQQLQQQLQQHQQQQKQMEQQQQQVQQLQQQQEAAHEQRSSEVESVEVRLSGSIEKLAHCEVSLAEKTKEAAELLQQVAEVNSALGDARMGHSQATEQCEASEQVIRALQQAASDAAAATAHERLQQTQAAEAARQQVAQLQEQQQALQQQVVQLQQVAGEQEKQLQQSALDVEKLQKDVVKVNKVVDGKRRLIEEMKEHINEQDVAHRAATETARTEHDNEAHLQQQRLQQLQNELTSVKREASAVAGLRASLEQAECEAAMTEERVVQLDDEVNSLKEFWQVEKEKLLAEKLLEVSATQKKAAEELKVQSARLDLSAIQLAEFQQHINTLEKQVSDGTEERRIQERRGVSLLKDGRKQMAAERRRADRLQEKLSLLLADPAQLLAGLPASGMETADDVSSVSSWSLVSGEQRADPTNTTLSSTTSTPQSPERVPTAMSSSSCATETADLVARVAALQTSKWQQEEQIRHLETSAAGMAQDLLAKASIIQHYCVRASPVSHQQHTAFTSLQSPRTSLTARALSTASPSGTPSSFRPGMRRMFDRIREVGEEVAGNVANLANREENSREINRRLQALLEETLLKNVHLQQDVDNLSKQVTELSLIAAAEASGQQQHGEDNSDGIGNALMKEESIRDQLQQYEAEFEEDEEEVDVSDIIHRP